MTAKYWDNVEYLVGIKLSKQLMNMLNNSFIAHFIYNNLVIMNQLILTKKHVMNDNIYNNLIHDVLGRNRFGIIKLWTSAIFHTN